MHTLDCEHFAISVLISEAKIRYEFYCRNSAPVSQNKHFSEIYYLSFETYWIFVSDTNLFPKM